jgi:hypothetical protein
MPVATSAAVTVTSTRPNPPGVTPVLPTAAPAPYASSRPCQGTGLPVARMAQARQAQSASQFTSASPKTSA